MLCRRLQESFFCADGCAAELSVPGGGNCCVASDGGREQKQGGCRVAGDGISAIGNARGVVELIDDRQMIAPFFASIA